MSAVEQGVGSGMLAANEAVVAAHADGRDAAVAAQDDGPKAAVAAQDDGPETVVFFPPKQKRSMSRVALAKEIEKDCGVKKAAVCKVLDSLAVIGLREVKSYGAFTVPKLAHMVAHPVKAHEGYTFYKKATNQRCYRKGRPAGKRVRIFPALPLKRSFGSSYSYRRVN